MYDIVREALALPPEQRREALLPMYRAVYEAYGQDWELNTAAMADDYVFRAGGAKWMPGFPRESHGREGYMTVHRQMLEALDVRSVEVDDIFIVGERRVAALLRFVIGAGSGTIDQPCLDVHDFREDGALVRQTVYFDIDEGRRELGL